MGNCKDCIHTPSGKCIKHTHPGDNTYEELSHIAAKLMESTIDYIYEPDPLAKRIYGR